jgi:hypothetical protein
MSHASLKRADVRKFSTVETFLLMLINNIQIMTGMRLALKFNQIF